MRIPPHLKIREIRDACDYLLIPFNVGTVRTKNLRQLMHELSNDGANETFERFVDELRFGGFVFLF